MRGVGPQKFVSLKITPCVEREIPNVPSVGIPISAKEISKASLVWSFHWLWWPQFPS